MHRLLTMAEIAKFCPKNIMPFTVLKDYGMIQNENKGYF